MSQVRDLYGLHSTPSLSSNEFLTHACSSIMLLRRFFEHFVHYIDGCSKITLPVVIGLEYHELISLPKDIADHLNRPPLLTLKRSVSMSKVVKTDTLV